MEKYHETNKESKAYRCNSKELYLKFYGYEMLEKEVLKYEYRNVTEWETNYLKTSILLNIAYYIVSTISWKLKHIRPVRRDLPQHRKCPFPMMAIRSPRMSASSIECVVNNIIRPFLIFLINCQVERMEYGSISLVSSSRMITCKLKL